MRSFLIIGITILISLFLLFITQLEKAAYIIGIVGLIVGILDMVNSRSQKISIIQKAKTKANVNQIAIAEAGSNTAPESDDDNTDGEVFISQNAEGGDEINQIASKGQKKLAYRKK